MKIQPSDTVFASKLVTYRMPVFNQESSRKRKKGSLLKKSWDPFDHVYVEKKEVEII